jgi:hypothetical protein
MTSARPTITGVLRKWRRVSSQAVLGYVYESDVWDEGEKAFLHPGQFIESANFYLFNMGVQVYKLPKEEELKDGSGDVSPESD